MRKREIFAFDDENALTLRIANQGGVDLAMMPESEELGPADETCREYERVVDPKYLDQIRAQAKEFSNKRLSRRSGVARSAIMNFKREGTQSSRVLCGS